jgi:hypothetical protein
VNGIKAKFVGCAGPLASCAEPYGCRHDRPYQEKTPHERVPCKDVVWV